MTTEVLTIADAVRQLRRALRLRQADFAKRVHVTRETVSAWEQHRATPSHEQRVHTVAFLADVPPEVLLPLVAAFGIAVPRWLGRPKGSVDGDAARRTLAAIRSAADDLDVPASAVRRMLSVVLAHLAAAGVTLDDAAAALTRPSTPAVPAKPRGGR